MQNQPTVVVQIFKGVCLEGLLEVLGHAMLNIAMDIVFIDLVTAMLAVAAVVGMVLLVGYAWDWTE
ncbi:hypothetical protein [Paraburkholderia phytofirmans]|uniref:Uncharacterized protein n=1 Tax=Paraburkholderia phytofirmans OLGA172 TaxID=1417228 RepID=A0A160FSG5_9BURK|nr:hypothetical protein [Paraburkholderia phytofirmans]ANB75822.1 hypothetical protein AYM40_26295 [Paraburkholderia phytofirmans OLGA172]